MRGDVRDEQIAGTEADDARRDQSSDGLDGQARKHRLNHPHRAEQGGLADVGLLDEQDDDDGEQNGGYSLGGNGAIFMPQRQQPGGGDDEQSSEEHTSELQSLMRISYAVFCLE